MIATDVDVRLGMDLATEVDTLGRSRGGLTSKIRCASPCGVPPGLISSRVTNFVGRHSLSGRITHSPPDVTARSESSISDSGSTCPPSTISAWPVTNEASALAR